MSSAMGNHFTKVAKAQADNEEVMAEIDARTKKRGDYYWWAKLCRQYTGSALCDSGTIYGYQYQRGIIPADGPHMHLDVWNGKPEGWSINLAKFLHTMFDADDEVAEAIEHVLNWAAQWLFPKDDWGTIYQSFSYILKRLKESVDSDGFEGEGVLPYIVQCRNGLSDWEVDDALVNLPADEYAALALAELSALAVELLEERDVTRSSDDYSFYTYNHDNDFDQDWMIDMVLDDEWGDQYAIIRTHNGCDARGGFSSPVVAAMKDSDYVYTWQADGYCNKCNGTYEDMYEYDKGVEKNPPNFPLPDWRRGLALLGEIEGGQLQFSTMGRYEWPFPLTPDQAKAILAWIDTGEAEGPPTVLALNEDDEIYVPMNERLPDSRVAGIYCPECGSFDVGWYNPVYGF